MKPLLQDIKRAWDAMIFANRASTLNKLEKMLAQDAIRPVRKSKAQKVARGTVAAFVPQRQTP